VPAVRRAERRAEGRPERRLGAPVRRLA